MSKTKNERVGKTLPQILSKLKSQLSDNDIKWSEQTKTMDYYEFILQYRGRYMLCKIGTFDPFNCKYRLIGNASYKTCPLSKFVDSVSQELLH